MSPVPDLSEQERFAQYWDAVVRGAPENEQASLREKLDPEVIALAGRMRDLRRTSQPDPIFRRRLEHTLMHAPTLTPTLTLPLPAPLSAPPNGHSAAPLRVPAPARRLPRA